MDLISRIKDKVRKHKLSLVLPESEDERVLKAAEIIVKEGLVGKLVLLGNPAGISLKGVEVIDFMNSPDRRRYTDAYYNLRKQKGITREEAEEALKSPVYYGMFMLKEGRVDALVSGSLATTANVLRATMHVIGLDTASRTMSSCLFLIVAGCPYGEEGIFLFADAGAVPDPTPEQLADIAVNTARLGKAVLEREPRVAMLSFSTKGSARHRLVDKVITAAAIAKEKAPDLIIDGELQADAALVPEIASRKLKYSPVAGRANVLIFPDLNSGNISYKLVQRLAKAEAYGPLILGVARPVSDLSRGCSAEDIVNTSAITLLWAGLPAEQAGMQR